MINLIINQLDFVKQNKGKSFLVFVAISGWILAIISFPLWYRESARIVWKAEQVSILNQSSDFDLQKSIGISFKKDLYVTRITFWNNGNLSIESKDVRRAISIISKDKEIADAKITDSISLQKDNFKIELSPGNVVLSWLVFDPGDAVKISVLHTGSWNALDVDGILRPNVGFYRYTTNSVSSLLIGLIFGAVSGSVLVFLISKMSRFSLLVFLPLLIILVIGWMAIAQLVPSYLFIPITVGAGPPL